MKHHQNRNNRLNALAVPVKHMLEPSSTATSEYSEPSENSPEPSENSPDASPSTSHNLAGSRKNSPRLIDKYYKATQKQIRSLRIEICRLKRRNKNYKTRLAEAEKISKKQACRKFHKINVFAC